MNNTSYEVKKRIDGIGEKQYIKMEEFLKDLISKEKFEEVPNEEWLVRVNVITNYTTFIDNYVMNVKCDANNEELKSYARKNKDLVSYILKNHFKRSEKDLEIFFAWINIKCDSVSYGMYDMKNRVRVSPGGPTNRFNKNIFH